MQASNCQHIKSLRAFAGEALRCPVRLPGASRFCPADALYFFYELGHLDPTFPRCRRSRFLLCYADVPFLLFAFCICTWAPSALNHLLLHPSHLQLVSHTPRSLQYCSLVARRSPDIPALCSCRNAAQFELAMAKACGRVSETPIQPPAYDLYGQLAR